MFKQLPQRRYVVAVEGVAGPAAALSRTQGARRPGYVLGDVPHLHRSYAPHPTPTGSVKPPKMCTACRSRMTLEDCVQGRGKAGHEVRCYQTQACTPPQGSDSATPRPCILRGAATPVLTPVLKRHTRWHALHHIHALSPALRCKALTKSSCFCTMT